MLANCDGMQHRARIFDFLKERNFLLLLDCVWQRLDLEEVGIPSLDLVGSCYNRRVVFTACSSHVCDQMNVEVENRIEVHCLDHTESWEIFKQNADLDYLGHKHVYLPRNISAELLGSPLELVTIGKAMHNKKDAIYWQNALHYLTESCLRDTQWSGSEEATFFRLKLAYDSLTGILKDCFKLCSLWPEGHIFNQRKLVDFWIGSGLIQGDDIEASYNEGFSHITTLQEFCLLEPAEDGEAVQMQSTIRDFALWVVHSQGEDKNKWRIQTKENWGLAEQVLLVGLKITELPRIPSNQKTLEVLILQHNYLEDGSFGNFPSLLSLQYLDLSFNKLSNIPVEICMQVNLRYLNLSKNRIKTVPVELGCLTRLRHLHLRNNPNLVIPNGILPKLQNLEVLDVCSFNLLQCSSYEAPINELVRMDKLQSLGITVRSETSFQGISKTTLPIRSLSIVIYNHEDGYETHVSSENSCINPERQTNLFELGIYTRQKTIVLDSIHSMWNVQHVEKAYLHGYFVDRIICQKLHTGDIFAKLRRLDIVRCSRLNHISWIIHLPLLEDLLLFSCSTLHQIIATAQDGVVKTNQEKENPSVNNTFPSLKRMTLIEAGALVRICSPFFSFPSLECLQISACPLLNKLPFLTVPSKLKCIRGENEWWDGLEWEDQDLEPSLELYFHGLSAEDQLSELYLFNSLEVEWASIFTP